MPRHFWSALIEGTLYSILGMVAVLAIAWSQGSFSGDWSPETSHGLLDADFARRWDGGCHGWTRGEAWHHLSGDLLHWWSYCTIAFVFWRLHPPLRTVPYSAITLWLVGWFILGCGSSHLLSAMTMLWPAYRIEGRWLQINGAVSAVSTVFVAYSLTRAFEYVERRRKSIDAKLALLQRLKPDIEDDD